MKKNAFLMLVMWVALDISLHKFCKRQKRNTTVQEGMILTSFTGERFSIIEHHKVKQVHFHEISVFLLIFSELGLTRKIVAVIKA